MRENTKLVLAVVIFLLISIIILPTIIRKERSINAHNDTPTVIIEEENKEPVVNVKVYKYTTGNLNMRTGPGIDFEIILTIPEGESVEILEDDIQWTKVIYEGATGYCSSEYLQ